MNMNSTDLLYMFHDLQELNEEEKWKELAEIINSLCTFPQAHTAHKSALNLFRCGVMEELRTLQEEARRVPDEDELIAHGANLEDE